ncbi:MAG: hypothetical protein QW302_02445 [Thermoplasmatales archaeon]
MRIQLIGLGAIGRNLLKLIEEKQNLIKKLTGDRLEVVSVSDSTGTLITTDIPLSQIIRAKEEGRLKDFPTFEKINSSESIAQIDADIVVEVTQSTKDGRPGVDHVLQAFSHGKDVVTANKSIMISDIDVLKKAADQGVKIRYEATVCGGLPVFNLMDHSIKVARIRSVEGVFNATSSLVLSEMEKGKSRSEAIAEAVKIGLAEHDPSDDLKGIDSARKGLILHRTIFGSKLKIDDAKILVKEEEMVPGVRQVTEVTEEGVRVSLQKKEGKGYLSLVSGPSMIIRFNTDSFDNLTLFTEHDGPLESSSAVLNDIVILMSQRAGKE